MKLKVELESDETIEQVEDFLEKSLKAKKQCSEERYSSKFLNEFHSYVCDRHSKLLQDIAYQVDLEIKADASKKHHI